MAAGSDDTVPPSPPHPAHTTLVPGDSHPLPERVLLALGADPSFAEAVLGDLAEEHAVRRARDGARAARAWYVREALRSTPYLLANALRHTSRHARGRLAAFVAGASLVATLVLLVLLTRNGPPARLVTGSGSEEGIVVNHVRPVQLSMQVLDAAGNVLKSDGPHFRWSSGVAVPVSSSGVLTCTRTGDARVQASLGPLAADLLVRCRPVRQIRATVWNDFVLGDPARELPAEFVGLDGEPVSLLSARVSIDDSTIATLHGLHIRPLRPGRTHLALSVGDRSTGGAVRVFAPARSFAALRPDLRLVAVPVRLAPRDSTRWPLPVGLFNLVFLADRSSGHATWQLAPMMKVDGLIMCMPELSPTVYNSRCLARAPGATLTISHPGTTALAIVGSLALEWERER